jgi:predicted amidohydrolase
MVKAMNTIARLTLALACTPLAAISLLANSTTDQAPVDWHASAPREEIRPTFGYDATGGRDGKGALVIEHDGRNGLDGSWTRNFPVQGGHYYRFQAYRKTEGVAVPRRSAIIRVLWQDDAGHRVLRDEASGNSSDPLSHYAVDVLPGFTPMAEAEYPMDKDTDAKGWTEVADAYRAPSKATRVIVELHLQWAPLGKVAWSDISLNPTTEPTGRKVRLAAVHFLPKAGKTPADKCRLFAPFIEDAARQHADLVVLPETLTFYGTGLTYADCAEPIPGPSTEYFGTLAKQHNLYIVAGLLERDRHLVYNVAALIGPDGKLIGKYRKVCLPRDEVAGGVAPGTEYPVFNTRFGKLGIMICYDGFFPEVARELSNRGAEVIAWPVWGCNPILASARACENHVYLVSSTYEDVSRKWMLSAVWDHEGNPLVKAEKFGTVIVSEVDLDQRLHWPSLGDFKADLARHRPISSSDAPQQAQLR